MAGAKPLSGLTRAMLIALLFCVLLWMGLGDKGPAEDGVQNWRRYGLPENLVDDLN